MALHQKFTNKILSWGPVDFTIRISKKLVLPGFDKIPLYDVAVFFIRGLSQGYLTTRAAAVSFSVFLAIFPFLIFLFSIIPFIPIANFQQSLLDLIRDFMPRMAFESVKETIIDIVTRPRSSILILNLILSLYFSTNGVNSLIEAFNNTYHDFETRSNFKQYLISLVIVFSISLLLIAAIGLITFGSSLLRLILSHTIASSGFLTFLMQVLRWLIILGLLLMAISTVYYLAPARLHHFRFVSAGSMLATFLIVVATLGFDFYLNNFSRYNALYGSLGTLMIVLVWIYLNALAVLIGFELNASIRTAGTGKTIGKP
jgi:membrane protein